MLANTPPLIFDYIRNAWTELTRSHQRLVVQAADPKIPTSTGDKLPVYIGRGEDLNTIAAQLRKEIQPAADFEKIEILELPQDPSQIHRHGLLYLPYPYVVPGGRFNEMYGWDSFFIQMGLLRDGQIALAKSMADNCVYEIREYGQVLNANRTYYLTRSQPPFLTGMLLAVHRHTKDKQWLNNSVPAMEAFYEYWNCEPHLVAETGLSQYSDPGVGPAPEVIAAERDATGQTEYDLIKRYFRDHPVGDYDLSRYYDSSNDELTPLFYKGDRAMRESGFDPSSRFGPFGAAALDYIPVCLNSLLYLMETQAAEIMKILRRNADRDLWQQRAQERAARMQSLLWNEKDGLYYDYDFVHGRVREDPFLTTFYPLWTGIATPDQAARVVSNLPVFERPGGLQTSARHSGDQWDSPFGWAPLQWIAARGLRRYGYQEQADRVSERFLSLVAEVFRKHGTMLEKYDVVRMSGDVSSRIHYGYRSNEAGFGWTNAVFTALFDELPPAARRRLEERWARR